MVRCLACHAPELALIRWLKAPDKMLAEKDPIAMELYARFNHLPMPNMRLSQVDVVDLIRYLEKESERVPTIHQRGADEDW